MMRMPVSVIQERQTRFAFLASRDKSFGREGQSGKENTLFARHIFFLKHGVFCCNRCEMMEQHSGNTHYDLLLMRTNLSANNAFAIGTVCAEIFCKNFVPNWCRSTEKSLDDGSAISVFVPSPVSCKNSWSKFSLESRHQFKTLCNKTTNNQVAVWLNKHHFVLRHSADDGGPTGYQGIGAEVKGHSYIVTTRVGQFAGNTYRPVTATSQIWQKCCFEKQNNKTDIK